MSSVCRPGAGTARRVVLVAPSTGLGGGIERYVIGLEAALGEMGIEYERLNLSEAGNPRPSVVRKIRFAGSVLSALRRGGSPARMIVAHVGLLPIVLVARRLTTYRGTTVIYYGSEVWRSRKIPGRRLVQRSDVRAVAISSFTSGALRAVVNSAVIAPPIPREWYETLVRAARCERVPSGKLVRILTVFRLAEWESKGLGTIIAAISREHLDVMLVVVGSGSAPPALSALITEYPWLVLKTGLTDAELAQEYASADLFVLATRTRGGQHASGEGFGLCLVEAQLAGTAVIAPAHGGSHDAFQPYVTGLAPIDESAEALGLCLRVFAARPVTVSEMGAAAARWSQVAFEPSRGAENIVRAII